MEKTDRIRIELTTEQQKQLKDASGKDFNVIEFNAEELEQRVAPYMPYTLSNVTITSVQF